MVGCSENNINFPDQLQLQAISPLLYFVGRWINYYSIFVLFLSQWIEVEIKEL